MKKLIYFSIILLGLISSSCRGAYDLRKDSFVTPDKDNYPETWFHFIGRNVSLEGITADLEAVAAAGISGVQFFHGQVDGQWPLVEEGIAPMSENWDNAVQHIAKECKRLGLKFTILNCSGWATSGGPWITPENAMRGLVKSRLDFNGTDADFVLPMPQPSSEPWRDYKDIAVLAFPTPEGDTGVPVAVKNIKGTGGYPWEQAFTEKGGTFYLNVSDKPHVIEMDFAEPVTVRTFEIPSINSLSHDMCYEPGITVKATVYTTDGNPHKIVDFEVPMTNWQDDDTFSIACPEVEGAVSCKVEISITERTVNMGKVRFYTAARKNSWESEAGYTLRAFERTGDDVIQSKESYINKDGIIDITKFMTVDGHLTWTAPHDGKWTILRVGHVNEGRRNSPAPPEGTGWECDKLSAEGPEAQFAGYVGRLVDGPLKNGLVGGMLIDSWECHTQTWTKNMENEFGGRCGYELRTWLPALFGYVIDEPETTSKFLLDWRGTIGDLLANKFFRRMSELAHENDLRFMYETSGGDIFPTDIMEYYKYADIPMCEFWQPYNHGFVGSLNFKPVKPTASAARMYGKQRVAAESFTSFALTWNETFEFLKGFADYHFIEGVTHNIYHTYTHNPQVDWLKPGTSFGGGIGAPFLRGQTWWPYMKDFSTYLARCSYMLEAGRPVSDVLWYLGDEISHKPDQNFEIPGYRYDYCNPDVLLNRLSVKDGRIVTPEGIEYTIMWIPDNKRMLPETVEKLYELIEDGAIVAAVAPKSIATLSGGEEAQKRFEEAVSKLWGNIAEGDVVRIGKGQLICSTDIDRVLEMFAPRPDVQGQVRWLHRQDNDRDWYFITPVKESAFKGAVTFNAVGAVELWDAVTGEVTPLKAECNDGYTTVELDLPQAGSCFVVFDKGRKHVNPVEKKHEASVSLASGWHISFPEGWGAPTDMELDSLTPWCEMDMSWEGRHFSGTAEYTNTFTLDSAVESAVLNLGNVGFIAEVKVNGKKVSTLWCKPYAVDIAEYLKKGVNTLEIDVTSTWFNRLSYDAGLPENERKTWVISGPHAHQAGVQYGLLGPVEIRY